ncbi:uncharacterized protein LOC116260113 [Nymphaea colorata]|nr:uncharacterized protein LOC116260113 [Nymphaea colorata]
MEVVVVLAQATPFTSVSAGCLRHRVKPFKQHRPLTFSWPLPKRSQNRLASPCSVKVSTTEQFGESSKAKCDTRKSSMNLLELLFEPVKDFHWKKAGTALRQSANSFGLKTLKWSLVIFFVISFVSDISVSILRNRELIIPVGLFIGCMLAEFLKEMSSELVKIKQVAQEGDNPWQLAFLAGFFLVVRLCFQGNLFLSHICNGGLMQILWWGKKLQVVNAEEGQHSNASVVGDEKIPEN